MNTSPLVTTYPKLKLFDPANLTEAEIIYKKYYPDHATPSYDGLKTLIILYNEIAAHCNEIDYSLPLYKYVIPCSNDFTDFESYIAHEKKSYETRAARAKEREDRLRYLLTLPPIERYCVEHGYAKDSLSWNIVNYFYSNNWKYYCGWWDYPVSVFESILTEFCEKILLLPDEKNKITEFLNTIPSCLGFGIGICNDGERALRTIVITCNEYNEWKNLNIK